MKHDLNLARAYNVTHLSLPHGFRAMMEAGVAAANNMTELQLLVRGW